MKQIQYHVKDPNGMHARPAGALAAFAKQLSSEVRVTCKEKCVDAKRLLSLMSLGALHGDRLTFEVTGEEEEQDAEQLSAFLENWQAEIGGGKAGASANE